MIILRILPVLFFSSILPAQEKLSVLLLDGQNNHDWEVTSDAVLSTLENSGRFVVHQETAPALKVPHSPRAPRTDDAAEIQAFKVAKAAFDRSVRPIQDHFHAEIWPKWRPNFSDYDLVVLNYNGRDWPREMQDDFVDYVRNGGGAVLIHASNNGFRNWVDFNEMIGLGWRPAGMGKCVKIDPETGALIFDKEAQNSSHGSKHAFQVTIRAQEHPVMRGLPPVWMHGSDELYHNMRGPAKNLTVLSSAYSDPAQRGSGDHEPITWEVGFGKGRVIVTSMGHFWRGQDNWDGLHCAGYQTILSRSCEYVATGEVTQPVPTQFPIADTVSVVSPSRLFTEREVVRSFATKDGNPYAMLSPEEELATFDLAPGYEIELAAAEPHVQEPVLTVWDGNGAMYVAEMRSYMQDENGTGTKELKNGRIKRLEDTTGDGKYDKVTIFVDGLNLPRAILPLDRRILVRETDGTRLIAYEDTDGDGIADSQETLFEGSTSGRNGPGKSVEHQDSGLLWNLDNWIYLSYNEERHRYTDGKWVAQKQPSHWTQWGLAHDDIGRIFWSTNSHPALNLELHPKYWEVAKRKMTKSIAGKLVEMPAPYDASFMLVKSHCLHDDRGGAAGEVRGFTSVCGQSIYRGNKLPYEDRGRYFVVDPTIHVLRRSNITNQNGNLFLTKAEEGDDEFLRSSDINCRFINTASGPDGAIYVTDMYRGIIQDAPWMNPDARKFTKASGLASNNQHGRIWRISHPDFPLAGKPKMLDESTAELVRHLEHENGWWRDTAQRLIILREDRKSVIPMIRAMVRYNQNALGRLHGLWTLEGIGGGVDQAFLKHIYKDRDWRVRRAAVQIAEAIGADFSPLASDPDPEVAKQLILSAGLTNPENMSELIQKSAKKHLGHQGVILASTVSLWGDKEVPLVKDLLSDSSTKPESMLWKTFLGNWDRGLSFPDDMPDTVQRQIKGGEALYFKSCVACHGSNGKGTRLPGSDVYLAPSLVESTRVRGKSEHLIPILLHGLMGPLDGKTYQAGFMAPAAALGITRDDRLAELLSYLRYAFGDGASVVTKAEVEALRRAMSDRKTPWTQAELEALK